MSFLFALQQEESLSVGITRVLNAHVQTIQSELRDTNDLKIVVHSSRKHLKSIRSILRLLMIKNGREWFRPENAFFRNLGSQLSQIRDLHVLSDSIDLLQSDTTSRLTSFNTGEVTKYISLDVSKEESSLKQENVLQSIAESLDERPIPNTLLHEQEGVCVLIDGLEYIYEMGYNNMYKAYLHPTAENFHEWRKSVKHLLHICQLLDVHWPISTPVDATNLKELSDVLGQEHDLANLQDYIITLADRKAIDNETLDLFVTETNKKRTKLQRMAEHLGKEIYAETAEYFIRYFQSSWCSIKVSI